MPKNFVGETFRVSLFSDTEKVYASEGYVTTFDFFSKIFLSQSAQNFRRGEYFSVPLFSGIENFFPSDGYVTTFDFLSNVFCPTSPNNLVDEPFCDVFQRNSGSEKV